MPIIGFSIKPQPHCAIPEHRWFLATIFLGLIVATSPLIPFQALSGTGYHDGQRIVTSFYLIVCMFSFCWRLVCGTSVLVLNTKLSIAILVFFWGLGFISSIVSYSPRHALYEWSNLLMLFFVSWMIATDIAYHSSNFLDRMLLLCGAGCSLYIFQAVVAYVSFIVVGLQPDPQDLIVGFDNYRFLNHVQTISLPLLGILAIRGFKTNTSAYISSKYWFLILTLWWMLTFVSGGRGTFLSVWLGMLVVISLYFRKAWPWFRIMSLSCALGLITYMFFYWFVPCLFDLQPFGLLLNIVERTVADPGSSRWPLWQRAIELTASHPWLGVGPLHFAHFSQDLKIAAHPHNFLLQIAAEWGLPALTIFIMLIISGICALVSVGHVISPIDFRNQTLHAAFAATAISIFIDCLVSGLMVMPTSQLWIATYVGCSWGWIASQTKSNKLFKYVEKM